MAHASQQGCPPKTPEQIDPEHTVLLLVPCRTTSTSESAAHNIVAVYLTKLASSCIILSFQKFNSQKKISELLIILKFLQLFITSVMRGSMDA